MHAKKMLTAALITFNSTILFASNDADSIASVLEFHEKAIIKIIKDVKTLNEKDKKIAKSQKEDQDKIKRLTTKINELEKVILKQNSTLYLMQRKIDEMNNKENKDKGLIANNDRKTFKLIANYIDSKDLHNSDDKLKEQKINNLKTGNYKVITMSLNVRSKPSLDAEIVKRLTLDQVIDVDFIVNSKWLALKNGGFVYRSLVSKIDNTIKKYRVSKNNILVHEKPITSSKVIDVLHKGEEVNVFATDYVYGYKKIVGKNGFVRGKFLVEIK